MTIDAVNNVGTKQQEQKSHLVANAAGSAVIGGVASYAIMKEPISAKKVLELKSDQFEKTFAEIPETNKATVGRIKNIRAQATDEALAARADKKIANKLITKDGKASLEALKSSFIEQGKQKALKSVGRYLELLGDAVPKVRSLGKAASFAGGAAILSMALSLIFDRPKKEELAPTTPETK